MKFRFRTIVGLFCETVLIGNTEQKCSFYRKIAKETKRTNFLTCTTDKRLRLKNIKKLIALHIVCGADDEFIRESYGLTKMQLAGHKRNVTHKKLKGELTAYLSDIQLNKELLK